MKQLTYNQAVAFSIVMAAAMLREHPNVKIETTDNDGTDFESLGKQSRIIDSLKEDSERSNLLRLGIVTELNDITNFDHSHKLMRLFNGDEALENELISTGKVVNKFIESPYFEARLKQVNISKSEETPKAKKTSTPKKSKNTK